MDKNWEIINVITDEKREKKPSQPRPHLADYPTLSGVSEQ